MPVETTIDCQEISHARTEINNFLQEKYLNHFRTYKHEETQTSF